MKTTIIAVRHGFSKANAKNICTGHTDVELTEQGIEQAKNASEYLKKVHIDKLYSSDLCRAYDTAVPIAKVHNLKIEKNEKLRELFAGDWEGMTFSDIENTYPKEYFVWKNDIGKSHPNNGESLAELYERIKNAVFEIAQENLGKTICIATHATPIRILQTVALGLPAQDLAKVPWCANASISIFEFENGKLTSLKYGLTEHLGDSITIIP